MKTHTKEQGIEAMEFLIKETGLPRDHFHFSDELDIELGYEIGTPMVCDSDGGSISAYQLKLDWEYANDPVAQAAEEEYWLECLHNNLTSEEDFTP